MKAFMCPPAGWQAAHALHLVDLVDSFFALRLSMPNGPAPGYDAYAEEDASHLIQAGLRIAVAFNHVNRSMGVADLYPFVTSPSAMQKIGFAFHWLRTGHS